MSVAERLKAEGRQEGRQEGLTQGFWIGRIQTLEDFLEQPVSSREALEPLALAELEALHAELHRTYEIRYKRK
jgi:hypothetical protein